jgi:hypothetical protein
MNIDKAKGRIPDAIKQAYCVVVTVSEKDEAQAFKITVTDEPHFNIIKADKRSRVRDTAITAEALLPDGPYNLWRAGEEFRRVKDLSGAFAQLPHLPKMLKASAILDTLVDGCEKGTFVLRLTRPDGTSRSWWMTRPDENALNDAALELVLPKVAALTDLTSSLLVPQRLPGLWPNDEITVKAVFDYFNGTTVAQVDQGGYKESLQIPRASQEVVEKAISAAVENSTIWLLSGPASILGEPIPPGVLSPSSKLCAPPTVIAAAEILPENLKDAWKDGSASGLSIATALSVKAEKTLPWKTVRDVIDGALQARFLELEAGSHVWPCEFPSAQFVKLKVTTGRPKGGAGGGMDVVAPKVLVAVADLEPSQVQDFGDNIPKFLEIKNKSNTPIRFQVRVELGDGSTMPSGEVAQKVNALLKSIKDDLQLK